MTFVGRPAESKTESSMEICLTAPPVIE